MLKQPTAHIFCEQRTENGIGLQMKKKFDFTGEKAECDDIQKSNCIRQFFTYRISNYFPKVNNDLCFIFKVLGATACIAGVSINQLLSHFLKPSKV